MLVCDLVTYFVASTLDYVNKIIAVNYGMSIVIFTSSSSRRSTFFARMTFADVT